MVKKLCILLVFIFTLSVFSASVMAAGNENIYSKDTRSTGQSIVTITRPDGDESTFKKSYVISGVTDTEGVSVKVLIYDESKGSYVDFSDVDGESSWDIGSSGTFIKEFSLNEGANKIRIAAFSPKTDEPQINDFTITVFDMSFKNIIKGIKGGTLRVDQVLDQILGNGK